MTRKRTPYRKGNLLITTIQITPDQRDRLDEIAKHRDRSVAYIVREALDCYLCDEAQPDEQRETVGAR